MSNVVSPPYFDRTSIRLSDLYRDVGRTAERPFMIFSSLLDTSLGDLLSKVVFLATLKQQFDHARLIVRYRTLRPYSKEVIALAPNIDHATAIGGELPRWLAKRIPDMRPWLPLARWTLGGEKLRDAFYDLVVIDSMMDPRNVRGLPQPAVLRIPPEREDVLRQQLIGLGLDPDRWYATLHYRTSSYGPKLNKSPIRNSDPENYRRLLDYIVDELGGQVVQLGHPEMPAFPTRAGFVDLSRIGDSFMLQAYAVCHSRFLVAGPSGPVGLGWSFQVPMAIVDATDGQSGWGNAEQVMLTHEVTTPEGQVLRNRALYETGLLDYVTLKTKMRENGNYRIRKNSVEELAGAARHLFERTVDVKGWRPAHPPSTAPRPNRLAWPPQPRDDLRFLGE